MSTRVCGECTVCCTVLGVPELDKQPGTPCEHACGGCQIYERRPESCRAYQCAWLQGMGADEDRPDRSGVIVTIHRNRRVPGLPEGSTVAMALDVESAKRAQIVLDAARVSLCFVMPRGGGQFITVGPQRLVEAAMSWCADNGHTTVMGVLEGVNPTDYKESP